MISGTPLHKSLPDSGSFTSAAEKMFITSAAVMKQMNVLEDSLSFKLLERTNHSAVLPSASSLYQDARKNHSASRCGCGARSKNR
ncbi:LysR family transcriptional regulator [Anaerotruncus colihominis]|uniref:helix-turn-helix domain-containing protein n=1 Tax=Anaerotruncus colihominis TaxID=169435 RepID=UPI001E09EF4B|nr:LysR family transcriptional regulator [Anaerotruncus colihominis]HJF56870.1 LysR family transcriptional regulator [Anaerotruncus colihominis]